MENTPAPDNNEGYTMPNEVTVFGPAGPFNATQADLKRLRAESKANSEAFFDAVDNHWKYLTESEPNKLDNAHAAQDLMSLIVNYLVSHKKVAIVDIVTALNIQLREHRK